MNMSVNIVETQANAYPAFCLIGDQDDQGEAQPLTEQKRYMASLTLGARACGDISLESATSILRDLTDSPWYPSDSIKRGASNDFMRVVASHESYSDVRSSRVVEAAADGHITSETLIDEMRHLAIGDGSFASSIYNSEGVLSVYDEQSASLKPELNELGSLLRSYGEDSEEIAVANDTRLAVDAWTFSKEIIFDQYGEPKILSNREHIVFSRSDEIGEFHPVVTVLDEGSPILHEKPADIKTSFAINETVRDLYPTVQN